jgi:glycosyltransferase involved in cell wall biosynthesis
MHQLDIVITTYNRSQKMNELVSSILHIKNSCIGGIVVVDSSDQEDPILTKSDTVVYLRSSHKNQPFQRYLGVKKCTSAYVLFLDDDMEILDQDCFEHICKAFRDHDVAGFALKFEDKHVNTGLATVPKSTLFKRINMLKRFKNWFTGYPTLKDGKFGLCGNRGKQPVNGGYTEYVSGGAFAAKREALFNNFNFQLFDLFEEKIGMGEDAIIGYGLHKEGGVVYLPECWFLHNDQRDSTYTTDLRAYAERVLYSRYYLSLEKRRLDGRSLTFVKIHYHWYAFWRLSGLILNRLLSPSKSRKQLLAGSWSGWKKSLRFKFSRKLERTNYWYMEGERNCQQMK